MQKLKSLNLTLSALFLAAAFFGTAKAEVHAPDAYENLISVPLAPGHAPRTVNGVAALSAQERRHPERLPLQLEGPLKKIKKSKYSPSGISRESPSEF